MKNLMNVEKIDHDEGEKISQFLEEKLRTLRNNGVNWHIKYDGMFGSRFLIEKA